MYSLLPVILVKKKQNKTKQNKTKHFLFILFALAFSHDTAVNEEEVCF